MYHTVADLDHPKLCFLEVIAVMFEGQFTAEQHEQAKKSYYL